MGLNCVCVSLMLILMFISIEGSRGEGCLEQERFALLELKRFFKGPYYLQDWVEGDGNSNCCEWERVECSNTTGRVISLSLSGTRIPYLGEWYLNVSLFSPFEELEKLDLYGNLIAGCVENEGFERLSHLSNLQVLYLGYNMFNDSSIFSALSQHSSLKNLSLAYNGLRELNHHNVSRLSNLEYLDLGGNSFNNSILSSLTTLSSLKGLYLYDNGLNGKVGLQSLDWLSRLGNLEVLNLGGNIFNNSILAILAGLSSLKSLYIYDIGLKGTVDLQEWGSLSNLETLWMGDNKINKIVFPEGSDDDLKIFEKGLGKLRSLRLSNMGISDGSSLLQSLGSFPSLKEVEISVNNFSETVTAHELHNFTNVEYLIFEYSSLHISLFRSIGAFTSLRGLAIYDCELNGILNHEVLSTFKNLEELSLEGTVLNNYFLPMIGAMTSLKSLSIEYCDLKDMKFDQVLPTFKNLEKLSMWSTVLNNHFLQVIGAMTSLKSLSIDDCDLKDMKFDQDLKINSTALDNNFLQTIGSLTSLELLQLSNCKLMNTLPEQGVCKLLHLQELDLAHNDLRGNLPWCLANLTSLQVLDISSNHFTGNISSSPLRVLTSIQDLRLTHNQFQIPISLEPFFNHSKLKKFYGSNNEIYAGIEPHSLVPNFQLNSIILRSYGDIGSFPKFLFSQHELQEVDLSHIHLRGEFPNWLLDNNTKLERLHLANCSLSGLFQLPNHPLKYLKELDISMNSIHGHIPTKIGDYLPVVKSFNNSRNAFHGSIPSSFGDMKSLGSLDLSNNLLSGEIPEHLAIGCIFLRFLVLSNNSLQGEIFPTKFNLINLSKLQLDSNNFSGKIPDGLSTCTLTRLYLSDNNLSGTIPRWLGNMTFLIDIIMPNNHLEGPIPLEFCQLRYLEILDLSENNISGSLPSCFSPSSIKQVHLSRNKLQGQLKDAFHSSSSIVTLDIGYNQFEGNIPEWIGRLSNLTYLILTSNNIQGEMPIQLCQLQQLRLIDLSHNNLSGYIPPCLNITIVNVAYDSLTISDVPSPVAPSLQKEETVEFTTKNISYSYQGRILTYMSGIDLSCNKLTGMIPHQIGNLSGIHALNFSHNNLIGPIPSTFSNLKQIESMDLSYNNLNGTIPSQLVKLTNLAVFSVAHNNLSGKIPDRIAQFGTFEAGSYEGNPLLCGQPLSESCDSPSFIPKPSIDNEEGEDFIDMDIFYISFVVSYIIVLLGILTVLYINPYWRRTWFYLVETWITSCYYVVVDHLPK